MEKFDGKVNGYEENSRIAQVAGLRGYAAREGDAVPANRGDG